MCTGNSVRSQMAEGLARRLAEDGLVVLSAGVVATEVHPLAAAVMRERGIDLSGHTSKSLWALPWWSVDMVVTLSEEADACWKGLPASTPRLHWALWDPSRARGADESLAEFRGLRDEIEGRIRTLLADLGFLREE